MGAFPFFLKYKMVIAGAGGHGLEVFVVLLDQGLSPEEIYFFDEDITKRNEYPYSHKVISSEFEVRSVFKNSPLFHLGVGNPFFREKLDEMLTKWGGVLSPIFHKSAFKSNLLKGHCFDQMPFSFVGPGVQIGRGVLINSRANVHHESIIGEYSDIGPGAMLLGASKVGRNCRIGAGAIILPGVELGDEVIVGAGAVVTKNYSSNQKIKGIPAK